MGFDDRFLSWTLLFSIAVWISLKISSKVRLDALKEFKVILIAAIVITLITFIMYSALYKTPFRFNKFFFLWFLINGVAYWLIDLILTQVRFLDTFLEFIVFGLLLNLVTIFVRQNLLRRFYVR